MNQEIFEKVKKIVVEQLEVDFDKVIFDVIFVEDLGVDFFDIVELVMVLEEEFDIEIFDEVVEIIDIVGKVVEYIESK